MGHPTFDYGPLLMRPGSFSSPMAGIVPEGARALPEDVAFPRWNPRVVRRPMNNGWTSGRAAANEIGFWRRLGAEPDVRGRIRRVREKFRLLARKHGEGETGVGGEDLRPRYGMRIGQEFSSMGTILWEGRY